MSGNSRIRSLQTAPIVSALRRGGNGCVSAPCSGSRGGSPRLGSGSGAGDEGIAGASMGLTLQVCQLVLADLKLVAVLELVRLDAPAVDIGAVQGAEVVDVKAVAPPDEQRVVSRDRHVVEEDVGVRAPADRHPLSLDPETFAGPSAARADHERSALGGDPLEINGLQLAGLADLIGDRGLVFLPLLRGQVGPALLAEVGSLAIYEAALGAVQSAAYSGPLPIVSSPSALPARR